MLFTNTLMTALCLEIFLWNASLAEWIDMPQFSDEKKVYRMPPKKQDNLHKFAQASMTSQFPFEYQSIVPEELVTEGTVVNGGGGNLSYELDPINESGSREKFDEEDTVVISTEKYDESMEEDSTNKGYSNESSLSNDTEILNFLPVDVLKSVHRTLKSQSTSSEGKMLFLKAFENTLMTEIGIRNLRGGSGLELKKIESRLTRTVTGGREKRGTEHYDHGHDYHEHDTGFPSIEGALMAISFLTFAVYLVRLVMLLFRTMNNPPPTTGATLLLGRRKRSVNALDEDTAKILSSVERFSSSFQ